MFLFSAFLFVSLALRAHSEKLECPEGLQVTTQILRTHSTSTLGLNTLYSVVCTPGSFDSFESLEIGIHQNFFDRPPTETQNPGIYQFTMEQMTYKKSCTTRGNVPNQYFVDVCRAEEPVCGIEVPKVAGGAFNLTQMKALPCETEELEIDDSLAMNEINCPYHTDLNGILVAQDSPKIVQYCGVCGNQLHCKTRPVLPPTNAFLGKLMMYRCEKEPCLVDRLDLYSNTTDQRSCGFRFEWINSVEQTLQNVELIQDECVHMSSATSISVQMKYFVGMSLLLGVLKSH